MATVRYQQGGLLLAKSEKTRVLWDLSGLKAREKDSRTSPLGLVGALLQVVGKIHIRMVEQHVIPQLRIRPKPE